jgi:tight adherence protein B
VTGPLLFGLLVALAVLIGFLALWRLLTTQDPVEARLQEYGISSDQPAAAAGGEAGPARRTWPLVTRLLAGFGLGPRLSAALVQADLSLTAAEFALIVAGAALLGYAVGALRGSPARGLLLAAGAACLPVLYLSRKQHQRRRAFTAQLPDLLTLLVSGLRAGFGLSQAMEMLAAQMPPPASVEFSRVLRAVGLGLPVQRALADMAARVRSDDLDLVVTAVTVQYEMGGNLAQTLETIGETVRDRIRIQREIRVMTAQQRLTGMLLAILPLVLGILLFIINPGYMSTLFQPELRVMVVAAVLMQVAGFLVIRRIVDIEV